MASDQCANLVWCPGTRSASEPGYLASLRIVGGCVDLDMAGRVIPEDFLKANRAIGSGRRAEAKDMLNRLSDEDLDLLEGEPVRTDLLFYLGKLCFDTGQMERAREYLTRVLPVEPHPMVHYQLAQTYLPDLRHVSSAVEHMQQAVSMFPDSAFLLDELGHCLCLVGRTKEGVGVSEQAVALEPDNPHWLERLLWRLSYASQTTRRTHLAGYQQCGRRLAPIEWSRTAHRNRPDAERPLRVGFISPDFRRHSVARAFEPLLDGMDRTALRLHGYACVAEPDEVTERFAGKFDLFRNVHALHNEQVADQIESDGVDILVELAGHCSGNCLGVLAYKPAPVQVDYGGISTSGIAQIDFRLTDEIIDPPETLACYTETSLYLPGGLASFVPPQNSPLVAEQPALGKGYVTFGSFNNNPKLSEEVLALWAKILQATPNARLILKFPAGDDCAVREHYYGLFERLGVSRERVFICGPMPFWDYLRFLSEVDIALDAFPYNGCITTMEALWMGVPIVTLTGDTYVSRVGLSILTRLGLEVFAAADGQSYVEKACGFAGQVAELQQIRHALRGMMLASPLCDPARLAREVQGALRTMWRHWCEGQELSTEVAHGP